MPAVRGAESATELGNAIGTFKHEDGCAPAEAIAAPDEFIPYAAMYGHGRVWPLIGPDDRELSQPDSVSIKGLSPSVPRAEHGLSLLGIFERPTDSMLSYFGRPYFALAGSEVDFLSAGGVIVKQTVSQGLDGPRMAAETRGAVLLQVGPYTAALIFGDETSPGLRPMGVWWSDGKSDWSVRAAIGLHESSVLVDLGRSLYCA